ncbi:hypothetical protein KFE96_06475 [Kordiimonas sp. SCSIO 12603]|uniref:hypothetical protein n=1 Tax=Kordiimonas sp. SCSIO 12603 TaxID=2829596 RepID=UPI002104D4E5|nr:hypothetical protein [Kordiimonas sp. SCSIO 12603]UTW59945.1 hypothetical protein KFE96_06475 [Kordiimonas sp. SCSIO 12603]
MSGKKAQQKPPRTAALMLMWVFVTPTVALLASTNAALFPETSILFRSAISAAIIIPLISFVISPLITAILKRAEAFSLTKTIVNSSITRR